MAAPADGAGHLLYIYVTGDGQNAAGAVVPEASPLAELAKSAEVRSHIKFSKASNEGLRVYDSSIHRYSRHHLKSALQFMGIKPHEAVQITETIFSMLGKYEDQDSAPRKPSHSSGHHHHHHVHHSHSPAKVQPNSDGVMVPAPQFHHIVRSVLARHGYPAPEAMGDFEISRALQDRKYSFTILLGGTSGCGKSTLASLLASRYHIRWIGFTTVISTDHIRHMLRAFVSKEESPVLYHAGECASFPADMPYKEQIIQGWEAQNQLLYEKIDEMIGKCERRRESIIIEGVHLSAEIVKKLQNRHPTCIPFLIYISNESKHKERFAIRAKYMTIDPRHNKYVKYIKNIRLISDHLVRTMDHLKVPKIDNTNIDRSIATIHSSILGCIRRFVNKGEPFWDKSTNTAAVVLEEYERQSFVSSSRMLKYLESKALAKASLQDAEKTPGSDEDENGLDTGGKDEDMYDGGSLGS